MIENCLFKEGVMEKREKSVQVFLCCVYIFWGEAQEEEHYGRL